MLDLLELRGWPLSIALPSGVTVGWNDVETFDVVYGVGSYRAQPDQVIAIYQQWLPHKDVTTRGCAATPYRWLQGGDR